ncbi:trafficking protein particle complex subunit 14-like [Glandiceps talaboti]
MAEDKTVNCRFYMYFPSSKPQNATDFRAIPARTYAYHGETVHFLLISEYQGNDHNVKCLQTWRDRMLTLCTSANASCVEADDNVNEVTGANQQYVPRNENENGFKICETLSLYSRGNEMRDRELTKPITAEENKVIFPISVSLDKLPMRTTKAKITVSIWSPEYTDKALQTHGYLNLFVETDPMQILQASSSAIKCNVNATMNLLSPPCVMCRHLPVAGKQYVLIRVSNYYRDSLTLHKLQVLPNHNENFLPPSPDGAHNNNFVNKENISKYIDVNSISMVNCKTWQLPIKLKPLEKHCVVFQIDVRNYSNHENTESFEVPLLLALSWSSQSQLHGEVTITHYKLPRIKIDLPSLVMSASCTSPITVGKSFDVTYTILNNLQDFVSVKLLWDPEREVKREKDVNSNSPDLVNDSLICHEPFSIAGYCQNGSTLTFTVSFQALSEGVFEIGQHMKLKLQYTASLPTGSPAVGDAKPKSRIGLYPEVQFGSPSPDKRTKGFFSGTRSNSISSDTYHPPQFNKGYYSPGMRSSGSTYSLPGRGDSPVPSPISSPSKRITTSSPSHGKISLDKIVKRRCQIYAMA